MAYWLDYAWRLPVALLIRAPLMLLGYGIKWVGNLMANIGEDVPGIPYRPRKP
jgi:hypothetical protein